VLLAFFILAIQLFVTLIEFKLTTLAGFVLIPFGLFGKTAFMAERVLGNVISSGIKVLVLAVIIGIGSTLFSQFTAGFGGATTIDDAMAIVLAALSLLGLGIFGPGIANGIVSGGPQLGAARPSAPASPPAAWLAGGAAAAAGLPRRAALLPVRRRRRRARRRDRRGRGDRRLQPRLARPVRRGRRRLRPRRCRPRGRLGAVSPSRAAPRASRAKASSPASPLAQRPASARRRQLDHGHGRRCEADPAAAPSARRAAAGLGAAHAAPAGLNHGTTMTAHAVRSGDSHGRLLRQPLRK
jgi:type IV secretion system protein TrbL